MSVTRPIDRMRDLGVELLRAGATSASTEDRFRVPNGARLSEEAMRACEVATRHGAFAALFHWSAHWAESGLPTLVVAQMLAASLAATAVPDDVATHLEPPWRAFAVSLPYGLFSGVSDDGARMSVAYAHVMWHRGRGRIVATDGAGNAWSSGTCSGCP